MGSVWAHDPRGVFRLHFAKILLQPFDSRLQIVSWFSIWAISKKVSEREKRVREASERNCSHSVNQCEELLFALLVRYQSINQPPVELCSGIVVIYLNYPLFYQLTNKRNRILRLFPCYQSVFRKNELISRRSNQTINSVNQTIEQLINQSINWSIDHSITQSIHETIALGGAAWHPRYHWVTEPAIAEYVKFCWNLHWFLSQI